MKPDTVESVAAKATLLHTRVDQLEAQAEMLERLVWPLALAVVAIAVGALLDASLSLREA